jgi:hypothetical protein
MGLAWVWYPMIDLLKVLVTWPGRHIPQSAYGYRHSKLSYHSLPSQRLLQRERHRIAIHGTQFR